MFVKVIVRSIGVVLFLYSFTKGVGAVIVVNCNISNKIKLFEYICFYVYDSRQRYDRKILIMLKTQERDWNNRLIAYYICINMLCDNHIV